MGILLEILTICSPILVALVGILPTINSNRKKTQNSILESNQKTEKSISTLQSTLMTHIQEDEEDKARTKRYRILRFYDEMCNGSTVSESHFEDILDDIDDYEKYCESHPNFKNSRGHVAMRDIRNKYSEMKTRGFF